MEEHLKTRRWVFLVLLFLLAFLPRAIQPVSRPLVWYLRSAYFIEDVLGGDWADTVYSEHPGVPLMWLTGIGLKLYWMLSGITPAAYTVPPDYEPIHFFEPVPVTEIAAALMPLALLIALSIVGAYLMLRRLFDESTAKVSGLLLATSPYYLAQSKILHLDALMATLMLLSALALLVYRQELRFHWLLLSGALGGAALLVKIPALFLVPFLGLTLLADLLHSREPGLRFTLRVLRNTFTRLLLPFLTWLIVAAFVYVVLWPVMWVEPSKGLVAVKWGLTRHATTAHDSPTLFLGEVLRRDPGPLFYPLALLFRASEIELTFLAVASVLGIVHLLHRGSSKSATRNSHFTIDFLLLLSYAVFFVIEMGLGAKKMPRYMLPALLALDVLAAAGIVAWARWISGQRHRLRWALLTIPVLVQALLVLPRHPYYGTALNLIAGGPPAAARALLIGEEGEGYAVLTSCLNAKPNAEQLTVAAQLKHVFNQTFQGKAVEIDQRPADYLAFHRNYTSRNYKIGQWGRLWERYAPRTPEMEVAFDGVSYAWLYPKLPPDTHPEHSQPVQIGDRFRFLGYDLRSTEAAPGDQIPVVLYWEATEPVTDDLSIFLHLLDSKGELIWQDDGAANHGTRPTYSWNAGEQIVDPHTVVLPSDLPEGDYLLTAGLYDWRTGERFPAVDAQERSMDRDQVPVATFTVRQPITHPVAWMARGLASLVLLSAGAALVVKPAWRCYNKRGN